MAKRKPKPRRKAKAKRKTTPKPRPSRRATVDNEADDSDRPERRAAFIEQFCIDRNGTRAAMRAGFSQNPASAATIAWRLLRDVEVRGAIRAKLSLISRESEVTAVELRRTAAKILRAEVRDVAAWDGERISLYDSDFISDDAAAAIAEVSAGPHGPRVKLHSKIGIMTKLARLLESGDQGGAVWSVRIKGDSGPKAEPDEPGAKP